MGFVHHGIENKLISWETHVILKSDAIEFYVVEPEENNPKAL